MIKKLLLAIALMSATATPAAAYQMNIVMRILLSPTQIGSETFWSADGLAKAARKAATG